MEYSYENNIGGGKIPLIESEQLTKQKIENLKAIGGREAVVSELHKAIKLSANQGLLLSVATLSHIPSLVLNSVGETRPLMWASVAAIISATFAFGAVNKLTMRRIGILTEAAKIETNN